MGVNGCPSDEQLAAFAMGDMSVSATDGIAAHLTDCAACRLRLERLDAHSDDVVLAIRRATPAQSLPTAIDTGADGIADLIAEGPGTRIGPYRLIQLLGEGGFGSVFQAEQTEPVRRQVALKLVKLGMDTRQVLARFKAERQALAMMDHPNIARVLDAGTTERGRPFFVMELAKGVAITEYCDAHNVPTRKRLDLFADVCGAVQHAHTKGVIHRDIKPSNVLITMRDDRPVPKVIDFGIAKAVGGNRLSDQTLYTELRQFIGTPEYMSPEQADPTALDVDARTDVYSLGVLLYELLTGTTPFTAKELRSKGLEQIGRTIREQDPPKPSTRVGALAGETIAAVAQRRGIEPRKLATTLRGELDWIVMKCLEKDRTLRYETANALGMDVRRYLADEPVRAGPPSTRYQLGKFVRRHRAGVVAAGLVAASMLVGLGVAIYAWSNASSERDRARIAEGLENGQRMRAEATAKKLREAAASRRLVQTDAVGSASPAGAFALLDALKADTGDDARALEAVRERFRQRSTSLLPGSPQRIRCACALALLGEPATEELVDAIVAAPASEGRLILAALHAGGESERAAALKRINAALTHETDLPSRARLAVSALFCADAGPAARMLTSVSDPAPRSAFIDEFAHWHGDLSRVAETIRGTVTATDADVASGLCLALAQVPTGSVDPAERGPVVDALRELYRDASPGSVHSAAAQALRAWQELLPGLEADARRRDAERGWYVTPSGLTMIRIPAGFSLVGPDGAGALPVLFTRPLYVADREVPFALFSQFADDASLPKAQRPSYWAHAPERSRERAGGAPRVAVFMNPVEAMRFCNWLSARDGLKPCYDLYAPDWQGWSLDVDADGYRLPMQIEWEYLMRAGSGTQYACGEAPAFLKDYAALVIGGPAAGALPNRWGLFDTLGGSWEMVGVVPIDGRRPPGVEPVPDPQALWPAVDPRSGKWQKFIQARGGADDSGSHDLRSAHARSIDSTGGGEASMSFRVVRNALPANAPGELTPPEDLTELWLRAADQRPWDAVTVKRGVEYAVRTGNLRARRLRFKEAADLFTKATQLKPKDPVLLFYVAALRLETGEEPAHLDACRQLLAFAMGEGRKRPDYTERAAKAMLLNPNLKPGPELYAVQQAARSVELGGETGLRGWLYLVDGMADYRQGKFEEAIKALKISQEGLTNAPAGQSLAEFFLAMSQHRAGEPAAARATYKAAAARMLPGLDEDPNSDWGWGWIDWLDASIAQREANRLLFPPK